MERDTTMPSILGPASGYDSESRSKARGHSSDDQSASPLLKVVFWAALAVVLWGGYRLFFG